MPITAQAWMDLETTGLDPRRDEILEIAVVLTDNSPELRELDRFHRIISLTSRGAARLAADPYVFQMHKKSGLLEDAQNTDLAIPLREAYADLIAFLIQSGHYRGDLIASGSGVMTFDMRFMREHMPTFEDWVVYWPNDVGILRRKFERLNIASPDLPESYADGVKKHRALDDTLSHIAEDRLFTAFMLQYLPVRLPIL